MINFEDVQLVFYKVGSKGITLAPEDKGVYVTIPFNPNQPFVFYYDETTSIAELKDDGIEYTISNTI